ncbi:phosphatases II [Neolentinus lepideus HHB14362 ss-1]|uniref:protein-tyrosine-phosphatase n=1 Tax=Neolentinus lepideus HHB14362 ss-1 TaxID=1314782 RepID=A0A165QTJ8_9AGAM|nr:phosphatases II [Neolentinus lepideus HHB14362 ss-1]
MSAYTPKPSTARPGRPKAGLHLNLSPENKPPARAPSMVNFDGLSPEVMEAMCTPMHLILPPASLPSSPVSTPLASPTLSRTQSTMNVPLHRTPSSHPTKHTGALWLGSLAASIDKELLRSHRISYLVQVLDAPWLPTPFDGIRCHKIDILDLPGADLKSHLEEACDVIDRAIGRGENVLVHCQQSPRLSRFMCDRSTMPLLYKDPDLWADDPKGVSRSAAIVIAYLISRHNMSFDTAHELVKKKRPCVKPNSGFVNSLREWEATWRERAGRKGVPQNSAVSASGCGTAQMYAGCGQGGQAQVNGYAHAGQDACQPMRRTMSSR